MREPGLQPRSNREWTCGQCPSRRNSVDHPPAVLGTPILLSVRTLAAITNALAQQPRSRPAMSCRQSPIRTTTRMSCPPRPGCGVASACNGPDMLPKPGHARRPTRTARPISGATGFRRASQLARMRCATQMPTRGAAAARHVRGRGARSHSLAIAPRAARG
eukprot:scaffold6786_cov384-Prasinococcus_capsulatus_cf.AAC.7